jgi:hypothetical protein
VRRKPSGNRIAEVRLTIHDGDYEASVAVVRNDLGDEDFQSAWTEGAALSSRKRSPTHSALHDGNGWGDVADTPSVKDAVVVSVSLSTLQYQ